MEKIPDIYEAFLRGNVRGLNSICLAYEKELVVYGLKINSNLHAVEDAVSESFWCLSEKIGTFERGKHINDFLYKTVRFKCINANRELRRVDNLPEPAMLADTSPLPLDEFESDIHRDYRLHEIEKKMESLPRRRKEAFRLYFFENMTIEEIAAQMGITPNAANKNLRFAVRDIKVLVNDQRFGTILLMLLPFL